MTLSPGANVIKKFVRDLRIFMLSWSVCQTRLEKAFQLQTLQLITKICHLQTKKFYNIEPRSSSSGQKLANGFPFSSACWECSSALRLDIRVIWKGHLGHLCFPTFSDCQKLQLKLVSQKAQLKFCGKRVSKMSPPPFTLAKLSQYSINVLLRVENSAQKAFNFYPVNF